MKLGNALISEKRTLHLNVHKKWFDMIYLGIKKEEYRVFSPYWFTRLSGHLFAAMIKADIGIDTIIFSNDYAKDRRQFEIEVVNLDLTNTGREDWGAIPGTSYFVFQLGDIIQSNF